VYEYVFMKEKEREQESCDEIILISTIIRVQLQSQKVKKRDIRLLRYKIYYNEKLI